LPFAIPGKSFETVAGQSRKILKRQGRLKAIKLQASRSLKTLECFDSVPSSEFPGALVAIAEDHATD
jgi:hypothetical protein